MSHRACACPVPDPVMQADSKFYCHTCSFETGARPDSLEPEALMVQIRGLQSRLAAAEGLIAKWREFAHDLSHTTDYHKNYLCQREVACLHQCADELASVLTETTQASKPSPVERVDPPAFTQQGIPGARG